VTVSISLQSYRIAPTPGIAGLEPGAPANFVGNSAHSIYSNHLTPANLTPAREAFMDAVRVRPRFRFASVFEWLIAAAFLIATIVVGSLILREVRFPPPARALPAARPLVASIPPGVPMRAVSVPVLPFLDGKEVRIGDTVLAVSSRLG
jgi:hypothetical protein